MIMMKQVLISVLIVAICMLFLAVKMIFKKGAKFPNEHVSSSKALQDRGISCSQTQDKEERAKNPRAIPEHRK